MFWLKTICLHRSSVTISDTSHMILMFVFFCAHPTGSVDTLVSRQLWVHYPFNILIKCDHDILHYLNNYFNCGEITNSIFSHLLFLPYEDILKEHIVWL